MNESLNDWVRPIITLSLTAVFCYGFLAEMITAEVFVPTAVSILTWWFKSRDEEKKTAQTIETIKATNSNQSSG